MKKRRLMDDSLTRRELIKGGLASAALALSQYPLSLIGRADEEEGATLIPFVDIEPTGKMLRWQELTSWITPTEQLFVVGHYGTPSIDRDKWQLEITGLVERPKTLTLAEIKARKQVSIVATLECSGNGSAPGFMGAIGNLRWTGTPLGDLLRDCALGERGVEVVFFGADEKAEKIRNKEYSQNFARSLSRDDALRDSILLAYELNGEPLPKEYGGPLRLIVPGWFGVAWVKWLSRIEVLDRRYMSRFMARDYVTIRGEERNGKTIWRETSVGPIDIKSVLARAVRLKNGTVRLSGAAWTDGTPLKEVAVQIDGGAWRPAELDRTHQSPYAWTFWLYDWEQPDAGDHTVVSRAVDAQGRVQPAADDPAIKLKRTYWEANQQWVRRIRI